MLFLGRIKITLIIIFVIIINVNAQNTAILDFVESSILQNANISLMVTDAKTGECMAEHRARNMTVPASVMKIVTTSTALELLGADFQFITMLEMDNALSADSTLNGNLIIRGGGDPTLGSSHFESDNFLTDWVLAVKNAGVKTVRGKIIFDEKKFSQSDAINSRWQWLDVGNYYASGVYAISYKDNAYTVKLKSGAIDTQPQIIGTVPFIEGLHFENYLLAAAGGGDNATIHGLPMNYHRELYGTIPANRELFTIKGEMPHPADVLRADFIAKLKENGVSVENSEVLLQNEGEMPILLYKRVSPKLIEIVNITNFASNNHFAEHIFKQLALKKFDVATSDNAVKVVKSFWESKQLPVDQLIMHDGSGLSAKNGVSANFIVSILNYMLRDSRNGWLFKFSLPAAAREGTVKNVLKKSILDGKVRMKSGTISQVRCYAGYIDAENGKTYSFAVLVNNANGSSQSVIEEIERFLINLYPKLNY
ncbi:MAG: D-alanyl-D-alanine carboxypeptidase/D-alanyl-D-alanine-endopeptidase [Prevotellaceae bacterium]|jgi:D-alanyl-D-alanine carboxypeptidase/D-alanyl-D-alanine-endopeptidase (penicillin-binding protein 4)|nr:D-alanyl-D-alanine carboxypeptidase/D-alanyl-D-alanine-endopeptidase [Prevotellaceae bacterium]